MDFDVLWWLWIVFITPIFLIIGGGCFIYLLMGVRQLVIGYKEKNSIKTKAGWITTFISFALLIAAIIYYTDLISLK
ncbi:MAG: hypothetical protein WDN26_21590 [Chitinophagaceae bacterium]